MDALRQWSFSFCAALVASSMLRMVMPKGGMQKIYGFTLSVFMLCALLSPFFLLRPEFRLELTAQAEQETASRAQALGREAERQGVQTARLRLEKIVVSKLDELGIKPRAITIHISDDGKDSFGASAEILLEQAHRAGDEKIRRSLAEGLGFPVTLIYE